MDEIWGELLLIFFFIAGNAYFAAAEIALVSARKAPIAALAQKGDKRAQLVARLQSDPDTFLATVQVGISLMTILAGVLGGRGVRVGTPICLRIHFNTMDSIGSGRYCICSGYAGDHVPVHGTR